MSARELHSQPSDLPADESTQNKLKCLVAWLRSFPEIADLSDENQPPSDLIAQEAVACAILQVANDVFESRGDCLYTNQERERTPWAKVLHLVTAQSPAVLDQLTKHRVSSETELHVILLSAILCRAVSCAKRKWFVSRIMGLSQDVQLALMAIVGKSQHDQTGRTRRSSSFWSDDTDSTTTRRSHPPPLDNSSFSISYSYSSMDDKLPSSASLVGNRINFDGAEQPSNQRERMSNDDEVEQLMRKLEEAESRSKAYEEMARVTKAELNEKQLQLSEGKYREDVLRGELNHMSKKVDEVQVISEAREELHEATTASLNRKLKSLAATHEEREALQKPIMQSHPTAEGAETGLLSLRNKSGARTEENALQLSGETLGQLAGGKQSDNTIEHVDQEHTDELLELAISSLNRTSVSLFESQEDSEALKREIAEWTENAEEVESMVNKLRSRCDGLRQMLAETGMQLELSHERESTLGQENTSLRARITSLESKMHELRMLQREELNLAKENLYDMELELHNQREKVVERVKARSIAELEDERESHCSQLAKVMKDYKELESTSEADRTALMEEIKSLQELSVKEHEKDLSHLTEQFDMKIEALRCSAVEERAQLIAKGEAMLKEKSKRSEEELRFLRDELNKTTVALTKVQSDFAVYQERTRDKIGSYERLTEELNSKVATMQQKSATDQHRKDFEDSIEALNEEKGKLALMKYSTSAADAEKAEMRSKELEKDVARLNQEIASLRIASHQTENRLPDQPGSSTTACDKEDLKESNELVGHSSPKRSRPKLLIDVGTESENPPTTQQQAKAVCASPTATNVLSPSSKPNTPSSQGANGPKRPSWSQSGASSGICVDNESLKGKISTSFPLATGADTEVDSQPGCQQS